MAYEKGVDVADVAQGGLYIVTSQLELLIYVVNDTKHNAESCFRARSGVCCVPRSSLSNAGTATLGDLFLLHDGDTG